MGILKIGHRILWEGSTSNNGSSSPIVDDMETLDSQMLGADSGSEADDQDFAEVGCELGMVGDQVCSIPYELYDLPDLKEILSLETWNSCLTEEERLSLSAYLPDMDQHTFWLTMKDLLGGNDIFFGSPLTELYERLKGGFYPPKVTRFREGAQFFQRRAYYLSLGSYHENMVRTFSDMKRLWDQCRSSFSIDERMHVWKSRKNHKGMDPFDLNAYPLTDDFLGKDNTRTSMLPLSKKINYMDNIEEKTNTLPPPGANGMKLVAPKSSGKGVLKIKSPAANTFQTHVQKGMPSDAWASGRPQPKGVLKIVPKGPAIRQEQSRPLTTRLEPNLLVEAPVLQTSRFSPLPPSRYNWDDSGDESPLIHQMTGGREAYISPDLPNYINDPQRVEYRNGTTGSSRNSQGRMKKIKRPKDTLYDTFTDFQEHNISGGNPGIWNSDDMGPKGGSGSSSLKVRRYARGREKDWQKNMVRESREPLKSSLEPYPTSAEYYQGERHMQEHIAPYQGISEAVSGMSDIRTGEYEVFTTSFDRVKRNRDSNVGGSQKFYDTPDVSDGLRDGFPVPVTYKRRKAQAKLNEFDFVSPLGVETGFRPRMPKETNNLEESSKGIKIRFKK